MRGTHGTLSVEVAPLRVRRVRLTVLAENRSWSCPTDRAVIGTHESADLVLAEPTASRFHCEIAVEGRQGAQAIRVRDLGSRNGTMVDGVRVVDAFVKPGQVLTLGHARVRLDLDDHDNEIPLAPADRFGTLVGRSVTMRAVFHVLERAAKSDSTVLLLGETGTGKEAIAEALHAAGPRAEGPYVVVDCGALPANLLDAELFGHEKGAFTGAVAARAGAFEEADGGTIFLDEVGELAVDLQPKLLRVLEKREIKRVGQSRFKKIDVRVVAATNRDLKREVNEGRFRSDLYYRLAVVEVRVPPLRERADDVALLVGRLLDDLEPLEPGLRASLEAPDVVELLAGHPWPGNVRELRNWLARSVAMREQAPLGPLSPPPGALAVDLTKPLKEERQRWVTALEREYLARCLEQHGGSVAKAARAAGVDRIHLYRMLWRHGLKQRE